MEEKANAQLLALVALREGSAGDEGRSSPRFPGPAIGAGTVSQHPPSTPCPASRGGPAVGTAPHTATDMCASIMMILFIAMPLGFYVQRRQGPALRTGKCATCAAHPAATPP